MCLVHTVGTNKPAACKKNGTRVAEEYLMTGRVASMRSRHEASFGDTMLNVSCEHRYEKD